MITLDVTGTTTTIIHVDSQRARRHGPAAGLIMTPRAAFSIGCSADAAWAGARIWVAFPKTADLVSRSTSPARTTVRHVRLWQVSRKTTVF